MVLTFEDPFSPSLVAATPPSAPCHLCKTENSLAHHAQADLTDSQPRLAEVRVLHLALVVLDDIFQIVGFLGSYV
jgi:hypothetical protein